MLNKIQYIIKKMKVIFKKMIGYDNIFLLKIYILKSKRNNTKQKLFYKQFLAAGDIFFDVGANLGNRIEPLIGEGIKIIAIEPQEKCIKHLQKRFGNAISIIDKGLGEEEGVKELYISNACTLSSFSKEYIECIKSERFSEYTWNKKVDVKITTLDNLIHEYGEPKFIKIDVEGYEKEVLKGLSIPINFLSFEYTVPEEISNLKDCLRIIKKIYNNKVSCNYSIGESFELALKEWISIENILKHVNEKDFIKTNFGDIYIKKH